MSVLYIRDGDGNFVPVKTIQGKKGDPGYTPEKGKDYWTEDDKEEIKGYIDESVSNLPSGGGGSEENWELLNDITIEEEVVNIKTEYWSKAQKKIRVVLDTLAATADTSYLPVTIMTADVEYAKNIRFYAYAMPRKQVGRSFYEVECIGNEQVIVGLYHCETPDSYDNASVQRIAEIAGGRTLLHPIDAYGNRIDNHLTGFKINTYGVFAAGTRLRIWGVAE